MAIHIGVISGELLSVLRVQKLSKRVQVPKMRMIENRMPTANANHLQQSADPLRHQVGDDIDADVAVGAQVLGKPKEHDGDQQVGCHLVGPHGGAVEDIARHHVGCGEHHHGDHANDAHGAQAVGDSGHHAIDALMQGHGLQRPVGG